MQAFISYPNAAKPFALQAKQVFEEHGYDTWFWEHDRQAYGDVDIVLDQAIRQCDFVVHLCTRHTRRSEGQEKERLFAKVASKPLVLLVFRPWLTILRSSFVPADLPPKSMHNKVTKDAFVRDCVKAAQLLLKNEAKQVDENEPVQVPNIVETVNISESVIVVKR